MAQVRRSSLSRRSILRGSAIAGAGVITAPFFARHASAQEASPAASPAATTPFASTIAERASGEVRVSGFASPAEQEIIDQQVASLASKYPNLSITFEPIAAEYLTKIQTDIAAGNAADVFMVQNEYAQDFLSRNVLLAIDDFVAEDGVNTGDFYEPLINAYTWQDKLYGLPKDWSPLGAVYDPAILETTVSEFPTDWDTLRTFLQALRDANGAPALSLNPELARYILFLYQAGGNILNEDASEIQIGDDASRQALEYFYSLYTDGLIATPAEIGAEWPGDAFAKGLSSVVFEGNWMFPFLDDNAPGKAYAVAELPAGPAGKGTPAFTNAFAIFAGSGNPEGAWAVVNYLTSNEGAALASPLGLAIPPRLDLEETYLSLFPQRKPFLDAGAYATPAQYGVGGQQFQADASAVLQSLWAGQGDVDSALQQIVDYANSDITLAS
jgi:multiple sugar transport system substrate-binding protein